MLKGVDCISCRSQYADTGREDDVPCDSENGWEDCPYTKWQCGSPGNPGPDGCGLAPENVQAVEFYYKWKLLGDKAWDLIQLDFDDECQQDEFAYKLGMLEAYAPRIQKSIQKDQEARKELEQAKQKPRNKPRRRRR